MIERRIKGVANLYVLTLVGAALLLWITSSEAFAWYRQNEGARLLPAPAYLLAVIAGVTLSWRHVISLGIDLTLLDWARALRLGLRQTAGVIAALFALIVIFKDPGISRSYLGLYAATLWPLLTCFNRTVPRLLAHHAYRRSQLTRTLLVSPAGPGYPFAHWLERQRTYGMDVVGQHFLAPDKSPAGLIEDLVAAIAQYRPEQILVLSIAPPVDTMRALIDRAHAAGCRVYLFNDYTARLGVQMLPVTFDGLPFFAVGDEPLEDPWNRIMKRILDLAVALPLSVLALPLLALLVALMQRIQGSPGTLLFQQVRSGRRGERFTILKFRTMQDRGEGLPPSIYPFGQLLRRTSLDELPQLLNVLRGEMSLVGPRPHHAEDDSHFIQSAQVYRLRFFAKPGMTGLAQTRGYRGRIQSDEDIRQRLELDLAYIRDWSIWLDLAILGRTLVEMIRPSEGAR